MSVAKNKVKIIAIAFVVGVAASAFAIYAGTKDTGQINVDSTIQATDQSGFAERVNINNRATIPNGGLVGKGKGTVPAPQPTASESDEEDGAEADAEENAEEAEENAESSDEEVAEEGSGAEETTSE